MAHALPFLQPALVCVVRDRVVVMMAFLLWFGMPSETWAQGRTRHVIVQTSGSIEQKPFIATMTRLDPTATMNIQNHKAWVELDSRIAPPFILEQLTLTFPNSMFHIGRHHPAPERAIDSSPEKRAWRDANPEEYHRYIEAINSVGHVQGGQQ